MSNATDRVFYRSMPDNPALAQPIIKDMNDKRMNEFMIRFRKVKERLEAAQSRANNLQSLSERLPAILSLAQQGRFQDATLRLNAVEVLIPSASPTVSLSDSQAHSAAGTDSTQSAGGKPKRNKRPRRSKSVKS